MQDAEKKKHNRTMYIAERFVDSFLDSFSRTHRASFGQNSSRLPKMSDMEKLEEMLMTLFFPGNQVAEDARSLRSTVENSLEKATRLLYDTISLARHYEHPEIPIEECEKEAESDVDALASALPDIRKLLKKDAEACFDGDPASKGVHEIILCYPGFRALVMHRTAHFLFTHGVPLVPRMMNEMIHSRTGIDIHPGASIGESFFIDHGTGVVIGETTVIGNNVKLYQGVTLGALSVEKHGKAGIKRHPTIEDNVTIYANATILGDITIGHDTVIASNAWIKDSIPPSSVVSMARPDIHVRPKKS